LRPWRPNVRAFFEPLLTRNAKTTEPHPLAFLSFVQDIKDFGKGPRLRFPNRQLRRFQRRMLTKAIQLLQLFEFQEDLLEAPTDAAERLERERQALRRFHSVTDT
jgi:hypothetical protein